MPAGIVDLRDLASRYAWHPRLIQRFLAVAGLEPQGPSRQSFLPPAVLIAIAHEPRALLRSSAWLGDVERLILVRDLTGELTEDPDLREVSELEWAEARAKVAPASEVFHWLPNDASGCVVAMDLAQRLAGEVRATETGPSSRPILDAEPGPWIEVASAHRWPTIERALSTQVEIRDDRVLLRASSNLSLVDLGGPAQIEELALQSAPAAILPGEDRYLAIAERGRWRIAGERAEEFEAPGWIPLGFDPMHPIGWCGSRMSFEWLYRGRTGTGLLSATDHDWLCGPAKKLYGYDDNNPLRIDLSPDAEVFAAHFEHDVLVSSAVPIRWRAASDFDVADFEPDPQRALFFARLPDGPRFTDDLLDEDARDAAPVLVLGPDDDHRYAVDLRHSVYRIDKEEQVAHVGGPEGGFALFDRGHALVRRAAGRLLGGWFRWATIEDRGMFWREDLGTGERRPLGPAEAVRDVVPIAGAKNVLLIGEDRIRLL